MKKKIMTLLLAAIMTTTITPTYAATISTIEIPDKFPGVVKEEKEPVDTEEVIQNIVADEVHPLSSDEIGTLMGAIWDMNDGLTDTEYRIVRSALLTVGRIPYELTTEHPDRPGDEKELKDKDIRRAADKTEVLDCSHWVDWIYSLAMDDALGSGNTGYIVESKGNGSLKRIARDVSKDKLKEKLRPGDIMVYAQDDSHSYGHTAIFLGFMDNGDMLYVHESSARDNVSLCIQDEFGNGGTSSVYYFRHKKGW